MKRRPSRWAAGWLVFVASAATVVALPPATPATPPTELIAPPDSAEAANSPQGWDYSFDESGNFFEELDLSPRFRFQADWISYTRNNDAKNIPLFTGPEATSARDVDFDHQSGYRLVLGFMHDDYEIEGSFLEIHGLGGSRSGELVNAVVFDGSDTFNSLATSPAARAVVGLSPNFLESTTLFAPIHTAANSFSGVAADNETNELEYLDPGARFQINHKSNLQDFDLNVKGRRQAGRLLRFGVGYRNILFTESGSAALRGSFNTTDSDGDETPGFNDPNDGLSHAALTALPGAGLTLSSGVGGFLENAAPILPDQLLFTSSTRASNRLNGIQATVDATLLEAGRFELGGFAKAGIFHNEARGSITERYQDLENGLSTYTRTFSDSKDRVAFAGNLGLTGTLVIRENLRVIGGYELTYLSGVALGSDQASGLRTNLANVTSLSLQDSGSVLFHGGRLGIELLFP
jgi:hypothetical protein